MTTIPISFKLKCTWVANPITVDIQCDGKSLWTGEIDSEKDVPCNLEIEDGDHELSIVVTGHGKHNIIWNDKTHEVDKHTILELVDLEMDSISVYEVVCTKSKWYAVMDEDFIEARIKRDGKPPEEWERSVTFGVNGTWKMPFSTPLYQWLLETLM